MTCGNNNQDEPAMLPPPGPTGLEDVEVKQQNLTRLVSEGALSTMTETGKSIPQYVSGCEDEEGKLITSSSRRDSKRSGSPMRCVSEFDEVTAASKDARDNPMIPNPLCCAQLRSAHVRALRLEADLQPMRMILGRLMAHPFNKKGIFNAPVKALALGLLDYHQIIKKPMDLGTIKSRLYSISYQSKQEVAEDIWLVFQNAMHYNPPRNAVHVAARTLQDFFEELYLAVGGEKKSLPVSLKRAHAQSSASRRVSFTHQPQVQMLQPIEGNSPGIGGKVIMRTIEAVTEQLTLPSTASPNEPVKSATVSECVPTGFSDPLFSMGSPLSSTRGRGTIASSIPPMEIKQERKRRLSYSGHKRTAQGHSCRSCRGRSCLLCQQNCLPLEPTLLVCTGAHCAGAKIRKGSTYYIANDGSRQYCRRCFTSLPPVLSPTAEDETTRYKRDLLKRKNDEELVETWLTCRKCEAGVHEMCALHNSSVHPTDDYTCPGCTSSSPARSLGAGRAHASRTKSEMYTFITGSEVALPLSEMSDSTSGLDDEVFSAEALARSDMSAFIEAKVRDRLKRTSCVPNAEKTVTVRIISDCERSFNVPDVVRKHFRMAIPSGKGAASVVAPPEKVHFKSKTIALFQKVDGLDVCIFCMYVQEYEGDEKYEDPEESHRTESKKRVYIAYLDSVEHFRPRSARTTLYHELLVSYLASARIRGFESAHIWSCPPSRGNCFVFWNHPSSQRTPTKERLISWYHGALSRAIDCGVVTDVKSLYESDFHDYLKESDMEIQETSGPLDQSGKTVCPPLLEGDFWIEEAVRIHSSSLARHLKAKSPNEGKDLSELCNSPLPENDPCPARQIASLLLDRVMAHVSAAPFRRPVNAAAMGLKDYHKIVTNPMDLGTVYTRCVHGEYLRFGELVEDVELVFANAKKFNPVGHFVHTMAIEMEELFFTQLEQVTNTWNNSSNGACSWKTFSDMSMSLDMQLEITRQDNPDAMVLEVKQVSETSGDNASAALPPLAYNAPCEAGLETRWVNAKDGLPSIEDLLTGGPDALSQRMAGKDKWMIEKNTSVPPKKPSVSKKGVGKRRRRSSSITALPEEEPISKRRRQAWLGEEVGASVRSMRTSFFVCSLVPSSSPSEKEREKVGVYSDYTQCYQKYEFAAETKVIASQIADARSALLEFSQRRNLEFDTLRHAKYSTAVLLYHLHNHDAAGLIPMCTSCNQETTQCRWHKVVKVEELRKTPLKCKKPLKAAPSPSADDKSKYQPEELCPDCHAKHPQKDQFIPLPVSFPTD